jgi:hypothetical protein
MNKKIIKNEELRIENENTYSSIIQNTRKMLDRVYQRLAIMGQLDKAVLGDRLSVIGENNGR